MTPLEMDWTKKANCAGKTKDHKCPFCMNYFSGRDQEEKNNFIVESETKKVQ